MKKGTAVPLTGVFRYGDVNVPFSGAALLRADGSVNYGWRAYGMAIFSDNVEMNFTGVESTLAGAGVYDLNADNVEDGAVTMTAINCKDLPVF